MAAVQVETATVYRGARRRFFTKKAARRDIAKAAVRARCECDRGDFMQGGPTPPYVCHYHRMAPEKLERLLHLCAVMFVPCPTCTAEEREEGKQP